MLTFRLLRTALFVLPLAALLVAGFASAEQRRDKGAYLGAAFAVGFEQFRGLGDSLRRGLEVTSIDEAFGFDLWAGYRFGPHLAAEAQFSYLEGFDADVEGRINGAPFDFSVDLEMLAGNGSLKLYPFAGVVEPFVLGGVGGARIKGELGGDSAEDSYAIFLVGGGVDVRVTKQMALVVGANYVFTSGNFKGAKARPDMVKVKIGLQYRF